MTDRPLVYIIDTPDGKLKLRLCTPTMILYDIVLDFDEMRQMSIKTTKALWDQANQWR